MEKEKRTWTVTLADGSKISSLTLNGNNFCSDKELTAAQFEGKLASVTCTDGKQSYTMTNAELVQILPGSVTPDGRWWFILREIPEDEIAKAKTEKRFSSLEAANDDLVLMMADLIGG